jgi:hypothetical protein
MSSLKKPVMTLLKFFLSATLLSSLLFSCSPARRSIAIEEGWQMLGEEKVNFVRDVDEIDVNIFEKFTAIRFKVEDREVRLNNLKIYLDNGDVLQPSIDDVIPADQYSRDIVISSEGRMIDKIQFRFRTTGNILKGRANILVFGKKHDPYRY